MSLAAPGSSVRDAFEERIRPLLARHRWLVLAVVSVFVAGPLLALACVCLALAVLL